MDLSQIVVTDEWADWPAASPSSHYQINLRFYSVVSDEDGATLRLDIGRENERLLEGLYLALGLAERTPAISPREFETYMRAIYQTRMDNLLPYTLLLSQYAAVTTDTREVRHALNAEQRTLHRALRLMPYRIMPQLIDQPDNWREKLLRQARYLWTRVRLLFP